MVVQTTGYFNLSILFYRGSFFLFKFFFGGGSLFFNFLLFHYLSAQFAFQVGRKCKFFQWHDNEICEYGKVLVPQQRQRIITLEVEVSNCNWMFGQIGSRNLVRQKVGSVEVFMFGQMGWWKCMFGQHVTQMREFQYPVIANVQSWQCVNFLVRQLAWKHLLVFFFFLVVFLE